MPLQLREVAFGLAGGLAVRPGQGLPQGRGHLPVWGFAEVVRSESDAIEVGETLFGFLPMSSLLKVKASEHPAR